MTIKPLKWRKPRNSGSDFGHEESLFIADGIGGKYSITPDSGHYLLWWSDDEFTFQSYGTVDLAKAAAEEHWQKAVSAVIDAAAPADAERGKGATTAQMKDAPQRAIFIAPKGTDRPYYIDLAHHLGRHDLMIEGPSFFENGRYHGIRRPVIVDHAARLDAAQARGYKECCRALTAMGIS